MKLHEIISESKVSSYQFTPLGDDYAIVEALEKYCSQSIKAAKRGNCIYRGIENTSKKAGIYNPGTGERASVSNFNYHTVLLDTNPLNEGFPKRSKSFIASTDFKSANLYGIPYQVFPFNDVDIGVVNAQDLWFVDVDYNNKKSYTLIGYNSIWKNICDGENLNSMNAILKVAKSIPIEKLFLKIMHSYFNDKHELEEFINNISEIYSYKNLGMEKAKPNTLNSEQSEVWFSGKCIMIPITQMKKIKTMLEIPLANHEF